MDTPFSAPLPIILTSFLYPGVRIWTLTFSAPLSIIPTSFLPPWSEDMDTPFSAPPSVYGQATMNWPPQNPDFNPIESIWC